MTGIDWGNRPRATQLRSYHSLKWVQEQSDKLASALADERVRRAAMFDLLRVDITAFDTLRDILEGYADDGLRREG